MSATVDAWRVPAGGESAQEVRGSVVVASELARRFGEVDAVRGVSFQISEGEVFGFLGPNGAGKTTTIGMLCTLLRPTSGSALVAGHDVVRERLAVRRSIGLVFQDPTLDQYLSGEENLRFHAYAYGVPKREREQRMRALLELMELWERRKDPVRDYSGGMKRRLELARGLLHRPRVLFLDEPTLGLDPQTRNRIWEYVLELRRREGVTIFLTTHYMDEAEHCDRLAVIDHGEIVALDTPEALKDSVGGDVVTLRAEDNAAAAEELERRYGLSPQPANGTVSFTVAHGEEFLPGLVREFPVPLLAVGVRRPTLDDVFLELTGRAIRDEHADELAQLRRMARMRGR
ncbi:MAG TPA: ATP-binding cassette domain-containing protein [Gaiellaceae bacterium]|nr:ATP-binding cassette domain-containing protein [Gaiellaceae bacterium]